MVWGASPVGGYGMLEVVGQGVDAIKLVRVGGTRYEMGYHYGRLLASDIAGSRAGILGAYPIPPQQFAYAVASMWKPAYFDTAAYEQELRGIAAGCAESGHPELTFEELRNLQLIPDMSELGCSLLAAWGKATANGHLYQLRNLDWTMDAGIQNYPVVAIYDPTDGGNLHAVIGFAGLIGVAGGGINKHGIAESQIMGYFRDTETLDGAPFPILLREMLYHDDTLAEALARIQSASRTNNYYYGISGPEKAQMTARLLLTSHSRCDVYADNQSVNPHPGFPTTPYHVSFDDVVYWNRHDGRDNGRLHDAIAARYGLLNHAGVIQCAGVVGYGENLLSVVYDATAKEFWVAYADGPTRPAYTQGYVHFKLDTAEAPTPLDEYVAAPDPNYNYQLVDTVTGSLDPFGQYAYTLHYLKMHSQVWRSPADVSRSLWEHYLVIVVPNNLDATTRKSLLVIVGGDVGSGRPDPDDDMMKLGISMAVLTRSVASVLFQVPSQPIAFAYEGSPYGPPHTEDAIIARTFKLFQQNEFNQTGRPTWPALLPMVKSSVRAMDAVQDFLGKRTTPVAIDKFVVTGASKRGWTTWLTAAVDDRVAGFAPLVIDLLNMDDHMLHHHDVYGFWADAIHDYEEQGIMSALGTPEGQALLGIVDPYSYLARDRIKNTPKFIVNATGDQFFIPDSTQFYWDQLGGPKYLRYGPNVGHSLGIVDDPSTFIDLVGSLMGFYYSILYNHPRPQYSWSLEGYDTIRVNGGTSPAPSSAKLWQAHVLPTNQNGQSIADPNGARDFRIETMRRNGWSWTGSPLTHLGTGVFEGKIAIPQTGWTGFFIEIEYPAPTIPNMPPSIPGIEIPRPNYRFTTQVRILPESRETRKLTVRINNPSRGHVNLDPLPADPAQTLYRLGTTVEVTAVPEPNNTFQEWLVFDPNHPGDANRAARDPNLSLKVLMIVDRELEAKFFQPISVTATAEPNLIKSGDGSTLTASATGGDGTYTYTWRGLQQTGPTIVVHPTDPRTYVYTVDVADGSSPPLTGSAQVSVTVAPPVHVSAGANPAVIASGWSSSLTATPSGGAPPYTYQWAPGESTEPNLIVTPAETTQYTVKITDKLGQTDADSVTVTVATGVTASAVSNPDTIPVGGVTTLTATGTGGWGAYTYTWSTGQTTQSIKVSPSSTTTYTVTIGDGLGQVSSPASVTVTVAPPVTVSACAEPEVVALGGSSTLRANVSGGKGPYQYLWSTGGLGASIEVSPTRTTLYGVTVSDALGQVGHASVTVTVVSGLRVEASCSPAVVRSGGSSVLTASATGGTAPYTYRWDTGQSGSSVTVNPVVTTGYTVTVRDSGGQESSALVTVEVATGVVVTVTATPGQIGSGQHTTLTVTATGGQGPYTHEWFERLTGLAIASGNSIVVHPTETTTYGVRSTDGLGQTSESEVTVQVVPGLGVVVTASPGQVRGGESSQVTAVVSGGVGPYRYDWNTGQTGQTIGVTPSVTTTYTVKVTDALGQSVQGSGVVKVQRRHMLTVSVAGEGEASPSWGEYDEGTVVWVTASAGKGWRFAFWGGDLKVTDVATSNPLRVEMDSAKRIEAVFVMEQSESGSPLPPFTPGCGSTVGLTQLLVSWTICGIGLSGLRAWVRRRRLR